MLDAIRLYLLLVRASVRSQLQYRFGVATRVVGLVLVYAGQIINLKLLLSRYPDINGWGFGSIILLFGLAILSWAVVLVTFFHFRNLEEFVVTGQFDGFMTRPFSPFLQFMAVRVPVFAVAQLIFSAVIFAWATSLAAFEWTWGKALFLIPAIIGGWLIQGAACVVVGTFAFWTTRSSALYHTIVRPAREMTWYPIDIYPVLLQVVFSTVLPLAFVNYFPAHYLLDRSPLGLPGWLPFAAPAVGVLSIWGAYKFWLWGMDRYQGAGH